jgi:pimeloyl-ACP methyl ester carboxylesterase
MRRKLLWRRLMIYAGGFLILYTLVCYQLARSYLSPLRHVPQAPSWVREVTIPTDAGACPAWATPTLGKGEIVFVLAHGYGGTREAWADLLQDLPKHGIDAVAPAMPGQDASPDKSVGFGSKESKVIADTVRWVRDQHPGDKPKIILMGVSMGGAASWLATEIVSDVDGVITEGAYAVFDEAMSHWFDHVVPGGSIALRPVVWFAAGMSGLDPSSIRPVDAASKWKGRPALVIQGEEDTLILRTHADRLAKASGAPLWVVPTATHAQCSACAGPEYVERLVAFAKELSGNSR